MNNRVYEYLEKVGLSDRIIYLAESTETVSLAAKHLIVLKEKSLRH